MDRNDHAETDAPTEPPQDAEVEKQRLIEQAARHGVDVAAALKLAEAVGHMTAPAEAYRSVERRLAAGLSLEAAEKALLA